jgi:hypothetical protein
MYEEFGYSSGDSVELGLLQQDLRTTSKRLKSLKKRLEYYKKNSSHRKIRECVEPKKKNCELICQRLKNQTIMKECIEECEYRIL